MWVFINEDLIHYTESDLYFEKRKHGIWQITNQSWHKAVSQSTSKSIMEWIRQTRLLEVECSLWALNREFKNEVEESAFLEYSDLIC